MAAIILKMESRPKGSESALQFWGGALWHQSPSTRGYFRAGRLLL